MRTAHLDAEARVGPRSGDSQGRFADFAQLVKARLTMLVLVTTAVGYYMGSGGPFDWAGLLHVLIGAALAAGGAAALNQWWERDLDALMSRTCARPLPAGRMTARTALLLGIILAGSGVAYLVFISNGLAALLAATTIVVYIFAYTPLKRRSTGNTLIGAIPGALPPLVGWAAARGTLDFGAWTLFIIVFFWQMPHFFAVAWICRDDYERAGFRMLSHDDETGGRSASQAVLFCIILLLVAGTPAFIGMVRPFYLALELFLGGAFTVLALRFHSAPNLATARKLFFGSIAYLPLLLAGLMLSKA